MHDHIPAHDLGPDEILSLASSIADRDIRESQWRLSILAETVPIPLGQPVEVQRSIQTGTTVAILRRLDNPSKPIDFADIMRTTIDDNALADMIRSSDNEPTAENIAKFRASIEAQMDATRKHFSDDQDNQENTKKLLAAAQSIAKSHSVSIHEVFASDELYAECVRAIDTPEEYAQKALAGIEKINQDFMMTTLENAADALLQEDMANGELRPEDYESEKAELIREIQEDSEAMADIEDSLASVRQATKKVVAKGIERFWGTSAPETTQIILGQLAIDQMQRLPLSRDFATIQKRNDVVITLCIEKGWDPKNLTVEQAKYINASPAMKDLRNQ
jgi:hypothetical protein